MWLSLENEKKEDSSIRSSSVCSPVLSYKNGLRDLESVHAEGVWIDAVLTRFLHQKKMHFKRWVP